MPMSTIRQKAFIFQRFGCDIYDFHLYPAHLLFRFSGVGPSVGAAEIVNVYTMGNVMDFSNYVPDVSSFSIDCSSLFSISKTRKSSISNNLHLETLALLISLLVLSDIKASYPRCLRLRLLLLSDLSGWKPSGPTMQL